MFLDPRGIGPRVFFVLILYKVCYFRVSTLSLFQQQQKLPLMLYYKTTGYTHLESGILVWVDHLKTGDTLNDGSGDLLKISPDELSRHYEPTGSEMYIIPSYGDDGYFFVHLCDDVKNYKGIICKADEDEFRVSIYDDCFMADGYSVNGSFPFRPGLLQLISDIQNSQI